MEEPSGLSSQVKLPEDINLKVTEKLTPYLLVTSVGTPNNGPLKNSSRDVELSLE